MPAMKLQKLVYYSQAWSLVWDEAALFDEEIQAWANGPVVRTLYDVHKGLFTVKSLPIGNSAALTATERETIDSVLEFYGHRNSQWLSDLSHQESPWQDARANVPAGEPSSAPITHAAMAEYYGSL